MRPWPKAFFSALTLLLSLVCVRICHAVVFGSLVDDTRVLNSVVAIETETGVCTGIIVGKKTILTAAHCINVRGTGQTDIPRPLLVRMFKAADNISEKHYLIENYYSSDSAAPGKDYGYIYLSENLDVHGPPIPLDFNPITNDDELCLAGQGEDENGLSGKLKMRCDFRVSLNTEKGLLFLRDSKNLKAGVGAGDSGGPVYRKSKGGKLTVVGIISRGGKGEGSPSYQPDRTISLVTDITTDSATKWISGYKCLSINMSPTDKSICPLN